MHSFLAASPFIFALWDDGSFWTGWSCLQLSLDGQSPSPGTVVPTGSHTFAVTFTRCPVDLLIGTSLDGAASAAYSGSYPSELSALVSVNSMRGQLVCFHSDLCDVTADGSGNWTRVSTGTPGTTTFAPTTTYTPTIGSTLVNNLTTGVATFEGGSISRGYGPPPPGAAGSGHEEFDNLVIAINGTSYTLNGSLQSVYAYAADQTSHTGEVRITSDGTLIARVYGDGSWRLRTEVLSPLNPF
jgi:hypothetical protein